MKLRAALCLGLILAPALAGAKMAHHHDKHAAQAPAPLDPATAQARRAQLEAEAKAKALAAQQAQQAKLAAQARAQMLAQQQANAAAALRGMETQTAQYAGQLANLQAAQGDAAQRLATAQAALVKLMPVMQRLATQPASTLLTAPLPPGEAVRSVALLQGIAAAITAQAQQVQAQTAQLAQLVAAAQAGQAQLAAAAAKQQAAEAALSAQIAAAKAAEQAAADQQAAARERELAARNELETLNEAVARLVPPASPANQANLPAGGGTAPVAGQVVQAFGAPTLAGPAIGVSYATAPGAHVVTPCAGTVMFAGNFHTYGNMVIANCGGGTSVVLAGMDRLDVSQGQRLVRGQPVGSMHGYDPATPTTQPKLYMEVRRNGAPVDPASWLAGRGSG
ncbi:murein hydrolase activator EnvC [Acidocella sp. KAb 2-4]|uniref:murein hydrolase activator EnvC family protein n=1 Tax=Acidocella sp. KAb 2-4 TaxID=2885158 RepID=UPI001D0832E8|nr:peptidoglycan DD-metalloendopeptidase family protein [Acidocella sp. KAb 2-4]MCB5944614.1 peptidoglycan DD-metalloendopeptidase family protein [Acidocella sp. KAb 2-4]